MVGTVNNDQGVQVSVEMPDVLIIPDLERCLLSPLAASKVGILTMLDSNPCRRTGKRSSPFQEASWLYLFNIDFGGGNEANTSNATFAQYIGPRKRRRLKASWEDGHVFEGIVPDYSTCHAKQKYASAVQQGDGNSGDPTSWLGFHRYQGL